MSAKIWEETIAAASCGTAKPVSTIEAKVAAAGKLMAAVVRTASAAAVIPRKEGRRRARYECRADCESGLETKMFAMAPFTNMPDDVKKMAQPILAHRLILKPESRLRKRTASVVVKDLVEEAKVPITDKQKAVAEDFFE